MPASTVRRASLAAAVCAVASLGSAGSAHASFIAYECAGFNLCAVSPDGSGQRALTTDGTDGSRYYGPSLSTDGTRMSWVHGSTLYVGDPGAMAAATMISGSAQFGSRLRQDGGQVLDFERYLVNGGYYSYVCVFGADGSNRHCPGTPHDANFMPDGRLLRSERPSEPGPPPLGICVDGSPGASPCATFVARDPSHDLLAPAVSPDGTTLAVIAVSPGSSGTSGDLVLYDMATGAVVRTIANGAQHPVWSPDGGRLAFSRDGGIWVASAGGAPGSEQRIADGTGPAWGGPPDQPPGQAPGPGPGSGDNPGGGGDNPGGGGDNPGGGGPPALANLVVKKAQRGKQVKGSVTIAVASSSFAAELLSPAAQVRGAKKPVGLGTLVKRHVRAGRLKFAVKLNGKGRRALAKRHSLKLTLVVAVLPPGAADPAAAKRQVNLRR